MAKPTIIAVDDDPQVLAAVERDLRARYRADYRVLRASSGAEALESLEELSKRGDSVALFLADQRMPVMEGTEFLAEAMEIYPDAKKVLLTAYADTEAAIASINQVGLDHYLMKPWDPPELNLYPVLDDLLEDWRANVPAPYDGIRVIGARWSAMSHDTKEFLARNRIPYRYYDVDRDSEARTMLGEGEEASAFPVIVFPDGSRLVQPGDRALAEKVGLRTSATEPFYDLIIIGGGPAGLAAAVYGASEGLRTVLVESKATGGQAGTSSRIENYLGFPTGISGGDLARRADAQAQRLGAEILTATAASGIRVEDTVKIVTLEDGTELSAHAVIIASGMTVRKLDVPGQERFAGAGIYYGAAPSEAASYRDEEVFVIGGANSAGQAAMMFSRYCSRVTMVVRGDSLGLKMSQYLVDQIGDTPNIEPLVNSQVIEVLGEDHVTGVILRDRITDEEEKRAGVAIFIFVGAVPHTGFLGDVVALDERGFVLAGPDLMVEGERPKGWPLDRDPYLLETSVPGIFAAGDVRHGAMRRVASAVGQGSVAISFVHRYLETV